MQDYLFLSFHLGHDAGEEARRLLSDCGLLEVATLAKANRHAWANGLHTGVSLRLPSSDDRIYTLRDWLRQREVDVFTRLDREYTKQDLDRADWLVLRVATAGLFGGVDYGQAYHREAACNMCGAGADPIPPLIAELGKMGKKDIDHLVYEGHLVATSRVVQGLAHLTGLEPITERSPRRPPDPRFLWLRIVSTFPRMDLSTTGYVTEGLCPTCGRSGYYGSSMEPEVPTYDEIPRNASDFNHTFEYFGNWRQTRTPVHTRTVGGSRGIIVSQRARKALQDMRVRRLTWVPVATVSSS
jgi:hypothetical protein